MFNAFISGKFNLTTQTHKRNILDLCAPGCGLVEHCRWDFPARTKKKVVSFQPVKELIFDVFTKGNPFTPHMKAIVQLTMV